MGTTLVFIQSSRTSPCFHDLSKVVVASIGHQPAFWAPWMLPICSHSPEWVKFPQVIPIPISIHCWQLSLNPVSKQVLEAWDTLSEKTEAKNAMTDNEIINFKTKSRPALGVLSYQQYNYHSVRVGIKLNVFIMHKTFFYAVCVSQPYHFLTPEGSISFISNVFQAVFEIKW